MSKVTSIIATGIAIGMAAFILAMPAKADTIDFSNPAFAPTGKPTSVPIGAVEFCKSHRSECGPNKHAVAAMPLTTELWQQLVDINNMVNSTVIAVTDDAHYQVTEYWTYPDDGYGDCEDFAIAKRKALIDAGWNPSTLLMTVVRESNGDGHAVLMVRTDRGDVVLDNQDGRVLLWNETSYQFLKRQSQKHAGQWVDIIDVRPIYVAAAK